MMIDGSGPIMVAFDRDGPLPSSPMKGEVPCRRVGGDFGKNRRPSFTSPFMGEAGRGPSVCRSDHGDHGAHP